MKIAYLVLAHCNPALVARRASFLSSPQCAFHVHIDAKADIAPFARSCGDTVHFTRSRVEVFWGEYSMIEATLVLMREALAAAARYDYLVLLSGSDYPLRSEAYIRDFLARHAGTDFIGLVRIPNAAAGIPWTKIARYRPSSDRPLLRFVSRAAGKLGLANRDPVRHLGSLVPYGGGQWWALTRRTCEHVLDFVDRNPRVTEFFRNTFAPDETFIHTIVGNAPFKTSIRPSLMYDDWLTVGANPAHPARIGDAHIRKLFAGARAMHEDVFGVAEVLFARKFGDDDVELLQHIEREIDRLERRRERDVLAGSARRA